MGAGKGNATVIALLVLFENALACQSRLILLDSILLFFTALAIMMWTDFLSNQETPWDLDWWFPLVMTGVSLGLAASVKWVGLFVIASVGISTISNLWGLIDHKITMREFANHFAARAVALILVPIVVYMVSLRE
jgi:dolichyl-phosphate-mannose-protein mannosyltransferase